LSTDYHPATIRLNHEQWAAVRALAGTNNMTPAEVLRRAVEAYLANHKQGSLSQRRLARIAEYQHLALDVIVREQYPQLRDRIIAETDKRLVQYHGA
jgi:hypothetical protein